MTMYKSKVIKNGNSQAISLNKLALEEVELKIGDNLECYVIDGKKIVFEKVEEQPYNELIKEYYKHGGRYMDEEINKEADEGK
ncbi:hypothetical protein FOC52_13795 (plasmid) [Staphylococcus cohnii]|nr:hypothetical protein FOC52_13795 [Staphylococcus cohnii]